jgi:LAO/AO transport system kinase
VYDENEWADLFKHKSEIPLIGITGPPGAGKSSMVNVLIQRFVDSGKKVAVVCVDPSSPFHQGALLGDRIRMNRWFENPHVYIRSLASRGSYGGLHPKIKEIIGFITHCGFDAVMLETVGVGQSEVAVSSLVDLNILVLVPEAGDEIQFMKAGLMETADVFVINKSDRPGADAFAQSLKPYAKGKPVFNISVAEGTGLDALFQNIVESIHVKLKNK